MQGWGDAGEFQIIIKGRLFAAKRKTERGENSHIPPASLSAVRILIDFSSERCFDASFVALSTFQSKHKIAAREEGKEKVQKTDEKVPTENQEGTSCEDVGTLPPHETLATLPQTISRNFVL